MLGSESGSTIPLFTGLVVIAFVVLGLAVDVARAHGAFLQTAIVADTASEAGAAMVDPATLHAGSTQLDRTAAEIEATRVVHVQDATIETIEVGLTTLCIEVANTHRTMTLAFIGLRDIDIVVRSCSELRVG